MNFKYDRISQDIKEIISSIITEKIDDLDYVTITDVEITKDLVDAKIYVTSILDNSQDYVICTLDKKKNFIKKELSEKLKIRKTPNLIFKYDSSLDNYNKIDKILNNK